jgi:hypothetical protein
MTDDARRTAHFILSYHMQTLSTQTTEEITKLEIHVQNFEP